MANQSDTIYAFATPLGRSGVSILRLSGQDVCSVIERLTAKPPPSPRKMVLRSLFYKDELLDKALLVYFQKPKSWTGEDVAEFHLHGSPAVQMAIAHACEQLGLRLAQAGEFSRRAFLNGRLDLAELEGLMDLINAETTAQRRQALRQFNGEASAVYEDWRQKILTLQAKLEAQLDFVEDVDFDMTKNLALLKKEIAQLHSEMSAHLERQSGEILRSGVHIALVGGANVGKSTLFNLLVGRSAAIVSAQAGTTRDILEMDLDLGGYPIKINDLAGLRHTKDEIEKEGVRRAEHAIEMADLRLILVSADIPAQDNQRALSFKRDNDIIIANKADLFGDSHFEDASYHISLLKQSDKDRLVKGLTEKIATLCGSEEAPLITRTRHREALLDCTSALNRFLESDSNPMLEMMGEDLRLAAHALGRITGRVGVEDMLDNLFAEFCIGK